MDIRLGTDLVYIPRIHDAVEQFGDRFLQRIDTRSKQEACGVGPITDMACLEYPSAGTARRESSPVIQRLAARWTAK